MMAYWLKVVGSLCAIWLIAVGTVYLVRSSKPTAQSITAYVQKNSLSLGSTANRRKIITRVADMLNRITLEERQKLRDDGVTSGFFHSLAPEEQSAFLDATLPAGFKQMMESFNTMEPVKRRDFVEHALTEMRSRQGKEPPGNLDDKNVRKIIDQGLRSFYSDSNAEVKLDLAPLIEQMQINLQSPR